VRKIIGEATDEVRSILHERRAALEAVARTLMEREVIDGAELKALIAAHDPTLKLVPGSEAVVPRVPPESDEEALTERQPGPIAES